jgi:hypothetical protein
MREAKGIPAKQRDSAGFLSPRTTDFIYGG